MTAGERYGYYEAIAHSGITLAAVIGEALAQEITEGETNPLIRPYRPGRLRHENHGQT